MNNELNVDTKEISVDIPQENVSLEHTEKTEVKESVKKSKTNKRIEKLNALKDKYEKAVMAQETAERKTQDINEQIEKIESEIHAEETAELDSACELKKLSYRQVAEFIKQIPEDMTLADILNIIL